MDFPRPSKSAGELFGDLKERLGFGDGRARSNDPYYDERDPYSDDQGFNDYDDSYGSLGYDPDTYGDPYDRLDYTTRQSSSSYGSSRSSSRTSSPRLVNSSDIRSSLHARTQSSIDEPTVSLPPIDAPESHEPTAPIAGFDAPATSYSDFVSPYKQSTGTLSQASSAPLTSPGLDSLFSPSDDGAAPAPAPTASPVSSVPPARDVKLVSPVSYDDVASVAPSVREGDIVVLSLRLTDADLMKRVLDFSFGVAAALDAHIECIAEKTFMIRCGGELTLEEHHSLQKHGIM